MVENPATSSPGLAFLLTTIATSAKRATTPTSTTGRIWSRTTSTSPTTGRTPTTPSSAARSDGTRPLVVSYASSPPAEVYFADRQSRTAAPTGSIIADDTCFRQIEFAGMLKRHATRGSRAEVHRLPAQHRFSGGHAAANVRLPGQPGRQAAGRVHAVRRDPGAPGRDGASPTSTPTASSGFKTWTETVLR